MVTRKSRVQHNTSVNIHQKSKSASSKPEIQNHSVPTDDKKTEVLTSSLSQSVTDIMNDSQVNDEPVSSPVEMQPATLESVVKADSIAKIKNPVLSYSVESCNEFLNFVAETIGDSRIPAVMKESQITAQNLHLTNFLVGSAEDKAPSDFLVPEANVTSGDVTIDIL